MWYSIYCLLNAHVGWTDDEVIDALTDHVKGGRDSLTQEHKDAILREHHDAQALYNDVMRGL